MRVTRGTRGHHAVFDTLVTHSTEIVVIVVVSFNYR